MESPFAKRDHFWLLAQPFLTTPLIAAIVLWQPLDLKASHQAAVALSQFIFLDGSHFILMYVLLHHVPELREWRGEMEKRNKLWLYGPPLAIFLIFFGLRWLPRFDRFQILMLISLLVQPSHAIAQHRGLAAIFNAHHVSLATADERRRAEREVARANHHEKHGHRWLFLLYAIGLGCWRIPGAPAWGKIVCPILMAASIIYVYIGAFRGPRELRATKLVFHARLLLYFFTLLNPILTAAAACCHGIEYLIVYRRIIANTQAAEKIRFASRLGVLAMMLVGLAIAVSDLIGSSYLGVKIGLGLASGLAFVHFYFDGVLFRMADPLTRSYVAPLLSGAKPATPVATENAKAS